MDHKLFTVPMLENLFDGEGGASGAAAGAPGEAQAASGGTGPEKTGETQKVLYGREAAAAAGPEGQGADAAGQQETEGTVTQTQTPEEKKRAFLELIRGEYKDQFTEESQRIINDRFKETVSLRQQLQAYQPLLDLIASRYGLQEGADAKSALQALENDPKYLTAAADEAGVSIEQYRQMETARRQMAVYHRWQEQQESQRRQTQQLLQWQQEAEQVKQTYRAFDLRTEVQNPAFQAMLRAGVPMQNAYESVHHAELMAAAQQAAAKQMERNVAASVRANGQRPAEAGASSQSGFIRKSDPGKLSKADLAEIRKRVERGEQISF